MILQKEFEKCGYKDILENDRAFEYAINIEDIFDINQRNEELLGIFISQQRDELYFLLDGDVKEINSLCDFWDNNLRIFSIINDKVREFQKMKYNFVQLIVYSGDQPDRRIESNLMISRKIIIKGNMADKSNIIIDDNEAIELPFHMIPTDAYAPDEDKLNALRQLLPQDDELAAVLKKGLKKEREVSKDGLTIKSLSKYDYECIKEWLDDDNT